MSIISAVTFNVFNSFVYVVTEPTTIFGKSGNIKNLNLNKNWFTLFQMRQEACHDNQDYP